jgi:catechol 2,3-dioxygenase
LNYSWQQYFALPMAYTLPAQTSIGHVHLKVTNLQRALDFYCGLLGFQITTTYGEQAAFISAGGYHHHIGLNTWYSLGGKPAPLHSAGLFHTAILFPERKDLAMALKRLLDAGYPVTGASDHGVSEAIYLDDPDGNGVELYWDRPKNQWPTHADGSLQMYTRALDLDDLLAQANLVENS